jgi:predicted phosphodiesterase
MRYAVVSDIHANWQAWNAVLIDMGSLRVDRIVCLGDIVGYGPRPAQVLESVHAHAHHLVLGNHDAAVCGKLDEDLFTARAAELVRWTRARTNARATDFLRKLPLTINGPYFRFAHGDFGAPAAFHYVVEAADALPSWAAVDAELLFVGHSHDPAIFVLGQSGTPHRVAPQDFEMEQGKRFLVNVGSVGQPRDGDARASYCIFDTDARSVVWRRLPFDLDGYRSDVESAGLDPAADHVLSADPRAGLRPVRELLGFSPPSDAADGARDVIEVAELGVLTQRVRRWQRAAALALAGGVLSVAGTIGVVVWHAGRRADIVPPGWGAREAPARPAPTLNLLPLPDQAGRTPEPLFGWHITLGNKRRQQVAWTPGQDDWLHIASTVPDEPFRIASPEIAVRPGMKFCFRALVRQSAQNHGAVQLDVTLWKREGMQRTRVEHFAGDLPDSARRDGWFLATETFTIPADGEAISVAIAGRMAGDAALRDIALTRLE